MFVPFITRASKPARLERRKGGGGGGKTSSGHGGSTGGGKPTSSSPSSPKTKSGGGSSSTPSGSKTHTVPLTSSTANGKSSAVAYGSGGGHPIVIPTGQMFAGRSAGGGMRSQIYGTRTYGSGYPGMTGRGVIGRGFPFWFWPIVWTGSDVYPGSYLQAPEYGNPYNSSRVGGPMAEATFVSNSASTTFHVLSDNTTVSSLISSIDANCSSSLSPSSSTTPHAYNAAAPGAPQPEQAIQYYRACSIVLTLDGYNNSATFNSNPGVADSPLPSGIDTTLMNCLNQTIALSAPLVSSASIRWSGSPLGVSFFGMLCLAWWIFFL